MMDEDSLAVFQAEAEGLVDSLQEQLLALQDEPADRGLIDGVFRDLHTLKGSGAMFGRPDIAGFLHRFESAFEAIRDGSAQVDGELISISLDARDHVVRLLRQQDAPGGQPILDRLAAHLFGTADGAAAAGAGADARPAAGPGADPGAGPAPAAPGGAGAAMPADGPRAAAPAAGPTRLWFRFAADTLALGGRPDLVLDELRKLGATDLHADLSDLPPLDRLDPARLCLAWQGLLPGEVTDGQIHGAFLFNEEGLDLRIERAADAAPSAPDEPGGDTRPAAAAPGNPPAAGVPGDAPAATAAERDREAARKTALMRVPADRLDDIMDRVGELVIAEARLSALAARASDPALMAVAEDIQRLTTAMRDTTMSIRMTPIGTLSGRFRRLVHDLDARLDRDIAFHVEGAETELDKTVVERLAEPLLHIIRNAADHGLEPPAERAAMGKPARGTITLSARYSGAEVLVSLSDDGRGLDRAAIRARATERGLIADGAELSDEALCALVFEPGFSTSDTVTDLSGRGVGMDVVRRTVESLRGRLEVTSEPGHGTTVTLRLPLTLAIIDGLLIEIADERYVIPLAAVHEIVELPPALIDDRGGNDFLDIRATLVPFLRLRHLLAAPGVPPAFQKVVVVSSSEGRVGLVVDRIVGSHQTVIKQLSPIHAGIETFSGATILGDGEVALILDVPQLVTMGRLIAAEKGRDAA